MNEKHTVIIDQLGRTILGVEVANTENKLTLHNPIILHFNPSPNGQLELQVFPLFFFELLAKDKRSQNSWTYDKSSVVISDVVLDDNLMARYVQINTPPAPVQSNPKVISIDDL